MKVNITVSGHTGYRLRQEGDVTKKDDLYDRIVSMLDQFFEVDQKSISNCTITIVDKGHLIENQAQSLERQNGETGLDRQRDCARPAVGSAAVAAALLYDPSHKG